MKVTHIITSLVYGGAERLLCNMSNIHIEDMDVEVIYLKGDPDLKSFFNPKVNITKIEISLSVFRNLRTHLLKSQPDVIHSHLGHADFITFWASRGLKARKFSTMHNIFFKWDWRDAIIFNLYRLCFKTIARDFSVISISEAVERHVHENLRVRPHQSFLVKNGIPEAEVSTSVSEIRNALELGVEDFVVLFVGRLRIQKAVHVLIRAIAEVNSQIQGLKLLIVGAGPEVGNLKALASSLSLQGTVRFEGTTAKPEEYFKACDLFVLPSVFEGLGLVILEAFRAGKPVIASEIEGPAELIKDHFNGLLFDSENVQHLSACLLELYNDPSLAKRIGRAARETFSEEYGIQTYASRIEHLYHQPID